MEACKQTTKRPVPLAPQRMKALLDQARFTNGKTDADNVLTMYKDISEAILAQNGSIDLNNQVYSEEDVVLMAEILPLCTSCKRVCMWGIDVGEHGAQVLAPAFKRLPAVEEIFVECSAFGKNADRLIPQVMPPDLPILALSNYGGNGTTNGTLRNAQCVALGNALAEWFQKPGSPKALNVQCMRGAAPPEFFRTIETALKKAGKKLID